MQSEPDTLRESGENLKRQFEGSGAYSIDRFLERQPVHLKAGKMLIAAALLPLERQAIRDASIARDWYQWFFSELVSSSAPELNCSGLSVVTFNYDRTLEFALQTMMINSFGIDPSVAEQAVAELPIHHVYGSLASTGSFDLRSRRYELSDHEAFVHKSAEQIRVVSSNRNEDSGPEFRKAVEAIQSADAIVFLGFGFDEQNLLRIGVGRRDDDLAVSLKSVEVFASGFGLGNRERTVHDARLKSSTLQGAKVHFGNAEMKCAKFLREYVDLRGLLDSS